MERRDRGAQNYVILCEMSMGNHTFGGCPFFSIHTFGGQVLERTEESLDTTINSEARDMISPAPMLVQKAAQLQADASYTTGHFFFICQKIKQCCVFIKALSPCFIVVLQMNRSKVNYLLLDLSFLQKAYKNNLSACSTGKLNDLNLFFK